MRNLVIITAVLATHTTTAGPVRADFCGTSTLEAHDRTIETIDHGTEGASVGDIRIGRVTLREEGGSADIGDALWKQTLMRVGDNETAQIMLGEYVLQDANGSMFADFVHGTKYDYHDLEQRPDELELAVTGGLGAYAGATGHIEVVPTAEPIRFSLTLSCPGG